MALMTISRKREFQSRPQDTNASIARNLMKCNGFGRIDEQSVKTASKPFCQIDANDTARLRTRVRANARPGMTGAEARLSFERLCRTMTEKISYPRAGAFRICSVISHRDGAAPLSSNQPPNVCEADLAETDSEDCAAVISPVA
jgi:hypothetical protein